MTARQVLLERLLSETDAGRPVAWCVVLATRGSTPQVPGAMALVDTAGGRAGTIGGGLVEAEVFREASELLARGESAERTFRLDPEHGGDEGAVCGGVMDVAIVTVADARAAGPLREALDSLRTGQDVVLPLQVPHEGAQVEYRVLLEAEPTLLIAGAGHVGAAVARLAVGLDFRVVVVDDRAEFANADQLPAPIEPVAADIERTLREYPINAATYVVIVTRGHKHDERALAAVVNSPARYVGMIGSRRKVATVFGNLREAGVLQERLDRVHSPIGLPIHGQTVPEIAVSICAELISVRRAESRQVVEGPLPVN